MKRIWIGVGIVVIIIIGLLVALWAHVDGFLLGLTKPGLQNVVVMEDAPPHRTYALGLFGMHETDPYVVDASEGLVYSADGTWSARAVRTATEGDPYALSSWTVELTNTASGVVTPLGTGHAPQFFTRDGLTHLFFLTPEGVAITQPISLTTVVTFHPALADTRSPAAIDTNGQRLVIQDPVSHRYIIYDISSLSPLALTPTTVLEDNVGSVGFAGGVLVGTKALDGHDAVVRFDGETGTPWYELPAGAHYRIITR